MRLTIKSANDETSAGTDLVRAHVERRLGFTLSRFEDRVHAIIVRLDDENGPKGGLDKRCRIELRGPEIGTLLVEGRDVDWPRAIDRASATAGRAVVRAIERLRVGAGRRLSTPAPT